MIIETVKIKEMGLFPELFLGIVIIYLIIYGVFISFNTKNKFPLIQTSTINLSILTLFMVCFLLFNDGLVVLDYISFSSTIANDYLGFSSKIVIGISSIICLLFIQQYVIAQRINQFEYIVILLFAILGLFLLCSSNDLITAYLAIELQSLSFYILAAFKKDSSYSIESGLKYFILGAFSSGLFLFGSSLIYGLTGSVNFEDFKELFFWVLPGSTVAMNKLASFDDAEIFRILDLFLTKDSEDQTFIFEELVKNVEDFSEFEIDLKNTDQLISYAKFLNRVNNLKEFFVDNLNEKALVEGIIFKTSQLESILEVFYYELEKLLESSKLNLLKGELSDQIYSDLNSELNRQIFWAILNCYLECSPETQILLFKVDMLKENFDVILLQFALIFILISLFFKLALAPFHVWAIDVYEGSPSSSTFFFAVVSKLSIFILLLRICHYGFYGFLGNWRYSVVLIAIFSVIVGSVAGLEQRKLKSLLAYSSISNMGYLLISFGAGSLEGIQMLFIYLLIYMISGLSIWSIFLLTRLKKMDNKKQNKDLADLVLLRKSNGTLAIILTIALFSTAGLPPMIGFMVKIGIFLTAIETSMYVVALISVLLSVLSSFYYIRIVKLLYFEPVLVGQLYYPINSQKAFILVLIFYLFIFLFANPTLLYLFSYKIGLMF